MNGKYLKKLFCWLVYAFVFAGLLCSCVKQQEPVEEQKDDLFAGEEHTSNIDTIVADGTDSVTGDIYADRYRYAEDTLEGVRMVDVNSQYTSGRLFYTVQSVRLARSTEEMGGRWAVFRMKPDSLRMLKTNGQKVTSLGGFRKMGRLRRTSI